MNHNEKCLETQARAKAWGEKYPKACPICHGAGELSYEENLAPHASGEVWMCGSTDLCTCVEDGECPRCGEKNTLPEGNTDSPCTACGWNWGKGEEDFQPDTECLCWMAEEF